MNSLRKKRNVLKKVVKMNNVQIISLIVCFMMEQHMNGYDVNEHIHIVSLFMNDCGRDDEQACDPSNTDTFE